MVTSPVVERYIVVTLNVVKRYCGLWEHPGHYKNFYNLFCTLNNYIPVTGWGNNYQDFITLGRLKRFRVPKLTSRSSSVASTLPLLVESGADFLDGLCLVTLGWRREELVSEVMKSWGLGNKELDMEELEIEELGDK